MRWRWRSERGSRVPPWRGRAGSRSRVAPPRTPLRLGVDADAAERILAPVLENACRYGRHSVRLSVKGGADAVEFFIAR